MKIKKSSTSLLAVVTSMLLVIAIFTGMFLMMQEGATEYSQSVPDKYNDSYTRLSTVQTNISGDIDDIKGNLDDIKEADDTFQVAWNGLKGLGNTLLLPVKFISSGVEIFMAVIIPLDTVPPWAVTLGTIALIAFLVFVILAVVKGEPRLV